MKVYLAQTDSAIKISKIITEHSKDKILNGDKIICGLVYRLMVPMTQDEIQESMNYAEELINPEDSEEDEELEHYLEDNDFEKFENIEKKEHKIVSNTCNCDICMKVRVCLLNYHNHECNDPLAQRFKNAIEHTCQEHLVII
jgi:Icc-related predicted phosphoesterase